MSTFETLQVVFGMSVGFFVLAESNKERALSLFVAAIAMTIVAAYVTGAFIIACGVVAAVCYVVAGALAALEYLHGGNDDEDEPD